LTFNAVHTPMEANDKYTAPFTGIANPKRQKYAAMMAAMDANIGKVLQKLKDEKLEEDTLVFFISDNGGPPANASNNGDLRGYKAQTWEGGIRVPYFISWKGKIPAGKTYDQPAIQLDITATALAAAGIETDAKLDGVNLLPYLTGDKKDAPHDKLYWRFGQQRAIRAGDWKLVQGVGVSEPILINLATDLGEKKDLSAEQPAKRKELEESWQAWNKDLESPRWKPAAAAGNNAKKKKKKAAP
jgi:arylsulfatase A-like enzyme